MDHRQKIGAAARIEDEAPTLKGWVTEGLDHPALRMILIAKAIDRLNPRTMAGLSDMTMAEWRVLSRLAPIDGATVGEVAELAWSDRAEVSRAASALRGRGLVASRPNPRDGRAPILYCTEAGRREHARIIPSRDAYYGEITTDLNEAELYILENILLKMSRRVMVMTERETPAGRPDQPSAGTTD